MPQIPYDPLAGILARSPIPNTVRADAWDAFHDAENEDDLTQRLQKLSLPDRVKADLWDLKASGKGPAPVSAEDFIPAKGQRVEGTSFADKIKNAASYLGDSAAFLGNEVVGAAKGAVHTGIDLAGTAAQSRMIPGLTPQSLPPQVLDRAKDATAYSNVGQQVGGGLETAVELAVPASKAIEAIPSAARAGSKFQSVMGIAKDVPIDVEAPGQAALNIMDIAEQGGGSLPQPVRQFANWVTNPKKDPMDYETARRFASGISRLSANEMSRLSPVVAREVAGLRVALNKSVADAAGSVGKGIEHAQAMTEYAKAMRLRDAIDEVIAGAKSALPKAIGGGAAGAGAAGGWWLTNHIKSLLGGD